MIDPSAIEHYMRAGCEREGGATWVPIKVNVGLEEREGDSPILHAALVSGVRALVDAAPRGGAGQHDKQIRDTVKDWLRSTWPDRYWFVELWTLDEDGWYQVFQPNGLPRHYRQDLIELADVVFNGVGFAGVGGIGGLGPDDRYKRVQALRARLGI